MRTTIITVGTMKIVILKCFAIIIAPFLTSYIFSYEMMQDAETGRVWVSVAPFMTNMGSLRINIDVVLYYLYDTHNTISSVGNKYDLLKEDIASIIRWQIISDLPDLMREKIQTFMDLVRTAELNLNNAQGDLDFEIANEAMRGLWNEHGIGREARLDSVANAVQSCKEVYDYYIDNQSHILSSITK